jgi:asparagine synthase (glutamine-hydrolysing)
MGSLVACVGRAGDAVADDVLAPLFAQLVERAADGDSARLLGPAALGCRAWWSTPEEVGERQPIVDGTARHALLFDGRLDDRAAVLRLLPEATLDDAASDGALVLALLVARGTAALGELVGPFALVWCDLAERVTHLARDPLGERPLCYRLERSKVWVASEPVALLQGGPAAAKLDEETLAAFYAGTEIRPEATFFADVRQVPAGSVVTVGDETVRSRAFWQPPQDMLRLGGAEEYVEAFRDTLRAAVVARLRGRSRAAVLTSGGLDSTLVAAMAGRLPRDSERDRPSAVSWRFRELPGADESSFAAAAIAAAGLEPLWVDGDGSWPLGGPVTWPADANAPFESTFGVLHAASFSAGATAGAGVLLTGHFSDEMYHGVGEYWLRDVLLRGAWSAAREGIRLHRRWHGSEEVWTPGWRAVLARLAVGALAERLRPPSPPAWLTAHGRRCLPAPPKPATRRPEQAALLLSPRAAWGIACEARRARSLGVDLRLPFRDRRLVELALRLPADQLMRPGYRKGLIWNAGEGLLPDVVRLRRGRTDLGPLVVRGLGQRESGRVDDLLWGAGPHLWTRWVRPEMLREAVAEVRTEGAGSAIALLWRCLAGELWSQARART